MLKPDDAPSHRQPFRCSQRRATDMRQQARVEEQAQPGIARVAGDGPLTVSH